MIGMSGPEAFEQLVAADYRARGYVVKVRAGTGDWGVDILATKGSEKLAIQAKMYGGARSVNRRQIFELYGAARYFECTGAVLATDGDFDPDAIQAARKLEVGIWRPEVARLLPKDATRSNPTIVPVALGDPLPTFDALWSESIVPLVGTTLRLRNGGTNRIIGVDWSGIKRVTSTGRKSQIPIEPFVWAVARIRERGYVTRMEINDHFEGRYSSGVALILAQVPYLQYTNGMIATRSSVSDADGVGGD
jgi:Restriction endonuclease